jgi:galactose mutarotase-like enzyme
MAPWCGRFPPRLIHGTVRGVAWSRIDDRTIEAPLGPQWEWAGRVRQTFDLHPDHLAVTATLETDGEPFDAALGWHPWFTKPASVDLDAETMLERGPGHLPTGRRVPRPPGPRDDCFAGIRWPIRLTWANGVEADVEADGCDYAVLYDEQAGTTCVEPQTSPPNATLGHVTVTQPLRAAMRIRWRRP